jgi:hypothetical protein
MLFIADMMSLVQLLIAVTEGREQPISWCRELRENPEILEEALRTRARMGSNVTVESEPETQSLIIRRGPDSAGHRIPTCVNGRSSEYQDAVERWIKDLESKS